VAVEIGFADQHSLFSTIALNNGVPNARWVDVARVGLGPERVADLWDSLIKALTDPLTDKEKESGVYIPPPDPRICFTGTLLDAQEFYQKTTPMSLCKNCPESQWTDGIPVIIPTEARVKKMLTGTSHKPEETMHSYTRGSDGGYTQSTSNQNYTPMSWNATVEKVAINAVMAGCRPVDLPLVLASMPPNWGTTNRPIAYVQCASGPIVKELGINVVDGFNPGNPPSMTIGRAFQLCLINIGGATQGSSNTNLGHPANRVGLCYGEDADALPQGWLGQNEVSGYKKTESAVFIGNIISYAMSVFSQSAFTDMNQGKGPIARYLGVEGKPGKYNILDYIIPGLYGSSYANSFLVSPAIAQSLWDAGLKSKTAVNEYITAHNLLTVGDFKKTGWFDFSTSGGTTTVSGTGLTYNALPDSYIIHYSIGSSFIIVCNSLGDDTIVAFSSGGGSARPVDPWR